MEGRKEEHEEGGEIMGSRERIEGREWVERGRRGGRDIERGGIEDKNKGREREKKERYKIEFWNVAGLKNKDREFWRGLEDWDILILNET